MQFAFGIGRRAAATELALRRDKSQRAQIVRHVAELL